MDKELNSLLLKYKTSIESLNEINDKQNKVKSSEKVISSQKEKVTTDEVNLRINKLKLDVDTIIEKRRIELENSKQEVQLYIDNILWNLFSRTEINNNTLLFNNDPNRKLDKDCLMKMMKTLIEFDKQEGLNEDIILDDWLKNIMTVYIHISSKSDKKNILKLLTTTKNISNWAIPLIQFNDIKDINEYIEILEIVFNNNQVWIEDDFLNVLDQLAIDYTFNKLVFESTNNNNNELKSTIRITKLLFNSIEQFIEMKHLVKLLSQTIIHLTLLLLDSSNINLNQEEIDQFIIQLVNNFYNLKQIGWTFLPNIPYKYCSMDALWDITIYLLQIKNLSTKPTTVLSLNKEDQDLPCITRFQYELLDNQLQSYFMLNCLTNIITCIPTGIDKINFTQETNKNILSTNIISIISYTLFTIAFIDKNLREIFYKDVRDSFITICQYHPFITSLLFKWTVQNISIMERMALYLFHSINLNQWNILKDDLKLLHQLLSTTNNLNSSQIQLAKYIIGNLNYNFINNSIDSNGSNSQPWEQRKLPFLNYEIHEEIAFILLDTCQNFQPIPDTMTTNAMTTTTTTTTVELVGSVISNYLPIAEQMLTTSVVNTPNEIIDWAWSIALKLKLYDCPISTRATEIDKSMNLTFLKLILNSYHDISSYHCTLLIYISFLLSPTSRHFLRFSSTHGWMKLLTILKRGKPESIIQILSEIIPSFVYMHGDDFFNDDSLVDFFKHMIELKNDPILIKAAAGKNNTTGIGVIISSNVWHTYLIDSVSNLLDDSGNGFSYVDLILHSWLKTIFKKTDWMWQNSYIKVLDTICKLSFILNRHKLVYNMLIEEQKRLIESNSNNTTTTSNSPRITRLIKTVIPIYPSLIIAEWSLLNLKQNTFNKTPGIETKSFWFTFEALIMETILEKDPYRNEIIELIKNDSTLGGDIQSVYKLITTQKKPIEFFSIYRWLQHILVLPVNHELLPLYLQVFFCLYYQRIDNIKLFGTLYFTKKSDLIKRLRDYIATVQTYYGQKMSDDTIRNAELLQQTFYAMWLWLGNDDLLSLETDIDNLPSHYNINRLKLCHGNSEENQPWQQNNYWLDLIDLHKLQQDFLNYPWEGSEKFNTDNMTKNVCNNNDSISLSTTTRRQRLMTGKSTILQLPSIKINDPLLNK